MEPKMEIPKTREQIEKALREAEERSRLRDEKDRQTEEILSKAIEELKNLGVDTTAEDVEDDPKKLSNMPPPRLLIDKPGFLSGKGLRKKLVLRAAIAAVTTAGGILVKSTGELAGLWGGEDRKITGPSKAGVKPPISVPVEKPSSVPVEVEVEERVAPQTPPEKHLSQTEKVRQESEKPADVEKKKTTPSASPEVATPSEESERLERIASWGYKEIVEDGQKVFVKEFPSGKQIIKIFPNGDVKVYRDNILFSSGILSEEDAKTFNIKLGNNKVEKLRK